MLSMVSGSVGFSPNPLDGFTLLPRAGAPAGGDDRRQRRGPLGRAVRADDLRVRCGAARLEPVPVARRLGREAAAPALRAGGPMTALRAPAPPDSPRHGAVESVSSWSRLDRLGLGLCWAAGIALCAICGGDPAVTCCSRACSTCGPSCCSRIPLPDLDQTQDGRLPRPARSARFCSRSIGIAIAAPGRRRDRGLADRVRAPRLARAGGRVRRRGRRRDAEHRARDLRPDHLPSSTSSASSPSRPQGGAVFGRSFLTAGAMMSLIALPLVVGAHARGAAARSRAHVREASYALGKTKAATIRRVLLPGARGGIATGATLGMGRIAGDTAIVVILLGALAAAAARRRTGPLRHLQRHRLDAHELRLQQLAGRRGQRAAEGLRGGVRAAGHRRLAQLRRQLDRRP